MHKRKYCPVLTVILTVLFGSVYNFGLCGSFFKAPPPQKRVDVITIDTLSVFGDLEKAPVEFLHDKHTEALVQKNLDCTACHLIVNRCIYPKFKRVRITDRIAGMNIYHENCIACHGEMNLAKEKTGPIECDDCHRKKNKYVSSRQPMGMDKSLHSRHLVAEKDQCQQCHHEYNQTEKTLFYAKGKEGTCRYCHGQEAMDNRMSMRLAAHIACINCHLQTRGKASVKPHVNCADCHDAAAQAKIKKATPIARLKRNQPDRVLLKSISKDLIGGPDIGQMHFVPFDHKSHEDYNDTCRVCHHASLNSCKDCHTINGSTDGKGVTLEKAAHAPGSKRSCRGCHSDGQRAQNCAGCHSAMRSNLKTTDASCSICHAVPISEIQSLSGPDREKSLVASVLQSRNSRTATYSADDIPERVTIEKFSNQYGPVDFPHLQVVNALVDPIKDSKLASYFHGPKDTICQACHHHSPGSRRPPNCGNCHPKQWDTDYPTKPGILGAYHQQCLGCHKTMHIEKPNGCTDCHKKKRSSN